MCDILTSFPLRPGLLKATFQRKHADNREHLQCTLTKIHQVEHPAQVYAAIHPKHLV